MTSLAAKKFCIKYKVARFYYLFVNGEKKIFRNVFFLLLNIVCFCSTKYEIKNIKNPIIFPLPLLRIQLPLVVQWNNKNMLSNQIKNFSGN
jgi:hypothetical protein